MDRSVEDLAEIVRNAMALGPRNQSDEEYSQALEALNTLEEMAWKYEDLSNS